jgi:putative thioredoxin
MVIDVTDATFEVEVLNRSQSTPVVIDLWAPWCGPCKTLGPILESVVGATQGEVVLAKVDVDQNPAIAQAFRAQSIPAVFAMHKGQIVDGFVGAQPTHMVEEFVNRLIPNESQTLIASLIAQGDETSLRQALELDPAHHDAIVALSELLVQRGDSEGALALLARIPETEHTRRVAAAARLGVVPTDDHDVTLTELLTQVKTDEDARQKYLDILELMGPDDPRTSTYRRRLTAVLF